MSADCFFNVPRRRIDCDGPATIEVRFAGTSRMACRAHADAHERQLLALDMRAAEAHASADQMLVVERAHEVAHLAEPLVERWWRRHGDSLCDVCRPAMDAWRSAGCPELTRREA